MQSMRAFRLIRVLMLAMSALATGVCNRASAADPDIIFAADFLSGSALQWVRRHPQADGATIVIGPVLVSAVRVTGMNVILYLQVPPSLNTESGYPLFSALKTFGAGSLPAVGDCVIAQGTIASFFGATELSPATITVTGADDCGGSPLSPYATTVAAIATDSSPETPDYQPGPSAEGLESVLVTLNPVEVLNAQIESFWVADPGGALNPPAVIVSPVLYQYLATPLSFLQITGVFDQANPAVTPPTTLYQLLPRGASDINDVVP